MFVRFRFVYAIRVHLLGGAIAPALGFARRSARSRGSPGWALAWVPFLEEERCRGWDGQSVRLAQQSEYAVSGGCVAGSARVIVWPKQIGRADWPDTGVVSGRCVGAASEARVKHRGNGCPDKSVVRPNAGCTDGATRASSL